MSRAEIAITGVGAVSPAGIGVEALWRALTAGVSLAAADGDLAGMPVDFSCRTPEFDAEALLGRRLSWRLDRFVCMALVAAREAVRDAGLDPPSWESARVGVVLGVGSNSTQDYETALGHLREGRAALISPLFLDVSGSWIR